MNTMTRTTFIQAHSRKHISDDSSQKREEAKVKLKETQANRHDKTFLFLTNDSFTVEGKGGNLAEAWKNAEKKSNSGGTSYRTLVAYDKFDKEGISYHDWKRITAKEIVEWSKKI